MTQLRNLEPKSHTFRLIKKIFRFIEPKVSDRQKLEQQYIEKTTEIQRIWGNPIPSEWDLSGWSDEGLDDKIREAQEHIYDEKRAGYSRRTIKSLIFLFAIFACLGIIGLLVFGVRQLFS